MTTHLQLQTTRLLHDEHLTTIALLERLEGLLAKSGPKRPPDPSESETGRLFADLSANLSNETGRHFDFEETQLFPRVEAIGDDFIAQLLRGEHGAIRPLADRLVELLDAARKDGMTADLWAEFHRRGFELVERQISHIQKEEMGLLPLLDELLEDDDTDLANEYAMSR